MRLARKMGLHRDGMHLGLSPFESEMRRRLWWHILSTDFRASVLLNTQPSLGHPDSDTKEPLNLEDEDLHPNQTELLPERHGLTTNTVSLLRCDVMRFLRKLGSPLRTEPHQELLETSTTSHTKKMELVKQLEDSIESKYIRYCDPANSLHTLILIMGRSLLCNIKLHVYRPRIYAAQGLKVPEDDRAIIFTNAKKLLEYMDLVRSTRSLDKYVWQIGTTMLWNALLYVLIEARHRKTGPEVDQLWNLIGSVASKYAEISKPNTGVVYGTLRKWLIEAWAEHCIAVRERGFPEPLEPDYITLLRRCQATYEEPQADPTSHADSNKVETESGCNTSEEIPGLDNRILPDTERGTSYDFSSILSFDADLDEWTQWESLVAGEELSRQL